MPDKDYDYQISASQLKAFNEDPRAFWFEKKHNLKPALIPVAGIASGIDTMMKNYCDIAREKGELPRMLLGRVPGRLLESQEIIKKRRHWASSEYVIVSVRGKRVRIIWAVDDMLDIGGAMASLDHKSKGKEFTGTDAKYNQIQADTYELVFRENGWPTTGLSYYNFVWPVAIDSCAAVSFANRVVTLEANPQRAMATIEEAVACLESPKPPSTKGRYSEYADQYWYLCRTHAYIG